MISGANRDTFRSTEMRIIQRCTIVAITLLSLLCLTAADDKVAPDLKKEREAWLSRLDIEIVKIDDDEERANAAQYVIIAFSTAGDFSGARRIMDHHVPANQRGSALIYIADGQSSADLLDAALATAKEAKEVFIQQRILGLIAIRQAQRGDLKDATALLSKITNPDARDWALSSIAEAQANAGDLRAAEASVAAIVDKDKKSQAQEAIKTAQADPIREIRSKVIRDSLSAMLSFSGQAKQTEAIQAIVAAQKKDEEGLQKHVRAALEQVKDGIALEQATTCTLLAVALAEAGRDEEAKQMILAARKANDQEWLGVSSLFGSPIIVHLLIRLDFKEEFDEFMNSFDKDDSLARLGYLTNLLTAGSTYAYLHRLADAETYYRQLKLSAERVHFAAGVLSSLKVDEFPETD